MRSQVDAALLQDPLERQLYDVYVSSKDSFHAAFEAEDFAECIRLYDESFFELIHTFFDKVLVNVDEQAVRVNRKTVMKLINELFTTTIADLSIMHF